MGKHIQIVWALKSVLIIGAMSANTLYHALMFLSRGEINIFKFWLHGHLSKRLSKVKFGGDPTLNK